MVRLDWTRQMRRRGLKGKVPGGGLREGEVVLRIVDEDCGW